MSIILQNQIKTTHPHPPFTRITFHAPLPDKTTKKIKKILTIAKALRKSLTKHY
jgi:hypothetical protein